MSPVMEVVRPVLVIVLPARTAKALADPSGGPASPALELGVPHCRAVGERGRAHTSASSKVASPSVSTSGELDPSDEAPSDPSGEHRVRVFARRRRRTTRPSEASLDSMTSLPPHSRGENRSHREEDKKPAARRSQTARDIAITPSALVCMARARRHTVRPPSKGRRNNAKRVARDPPMSPLSKRLILSRKVPLGNARWTASTIESNPNSQNIFLLNWSRRARSRKAHFAKQVARDMDLANCQLRADHEWPGVEPRPPLAPCWRSVHEEERRARDEEGGDVGLVGLTEHVELDAHPRVPVTRCRVRAVPSDNAAEDESVGPVGETH